MANSPTPLRMYAVAQKLHGHCRELSRLLTDYTDGPQYQTILVDIEDQVGKLDDAASADELKEIIEAQRAEVQESWALSEPPYGTWARASDEAGHQRRRQFARAVMELADEMDELFENYALHLAAVFDRQLRERFYSRASSLDRLIDELAKDPAVRAARRQEGRAKFFKVSGGSTAAPAETETAPAADGREAAPPPQLVPAVDPPPAVDGSGAAVDQSSQSEVVRPGPLAVALGLLASNPQITDTAVAKAIGVSRTTLYRPSFAKFQLARQAIAGDIPRGTKGRDGSIEASSDE